MDDNVDPRIFMGQQPNHIDPRIYMAQYPEDIDPRVSMRSSVNMNSRLSRTVSVNMDPQLARSISQNANVNFARTTSINNDPRMSMKESMLLEEKKPLKRNASVKMIKPVNHKKHSCTDVHCLLIFVCFIAAWIYIANYALIKGDLDKVLIPVDSNNKKCGLDSGVLDKDKLFFFNLDKCLDPLLPITGCETKQICVESCPKKSFAWEESRNDLVALKENLICDNSVDKNDLKDIFAIEKAIHEDRCSGWYMQSKPFFKHCVWDFSDACNFLPKSFTNRQRRSFQSEKFIDINALKEKYDDFLDRTKSWCKPNNQTNTNVTADTKKLEQPDSNSIINRIIAAIISKFGYSGEKVLAEHIIDDLKKSYQVILVAFVIHLIAVLIFITLLRWLAAPLVWISIVGVLVGLSFSLYYSLSEYRYLSREPHVPKHGTNLKATLQNVRENPEIWLYLSIVVGAALIIISLVLLVIRKRIKIAIAIIKEASKAITSIKSSIFFPIFPGILYLIVAILAGIIMLYLSSIGEYSFMMVRRMDRNVSTESALENCKCNGPDPNHYTLGSSCEPKLFEQYCKLENGKPCLETSCSFKEIVKTRETQWFMIFNVFGFLWVTFFISAYEDMVLACTFSIWYWTFNKKDIPRLPLLKAMWITTIYHLGTLAFGSLILSICRMIRYLLELIEKKAKMYNNAVTRAIICCMKCFFWILENFLRFLNRNAYITCAIHSTSFCTSSRKAFSLITQNILRVYAVDRVSIFLFFLSKILVTGCTSWATYFFLVKFPQVIHVYYPLVPVALVAISSYVMAHVIFSTYSMAVDTLFFCFLEDSTENDGSMEKPFYMSKQLNKLLGKKQKKQIRSDYIMNN